MGKKTASVRVHMEDELELALRRLADTDERDLSAYCRIVLKRHIEMMGGTDLFEQPETKGQSVPLRAVRVTAPFDDSEKMA